MEYISGLNSTASAIAVYASQSRVAPEPRKTRSRLVANPLPTGLVPARAPVRSFRHRLHDFLFSRLCLAQSQFLFLP